MNLGSLTLGVLTGMLYGLLAVGLVLVYRANKFLNLAHGQLGAYSAALLAKLCLNFGWTYWAAFTFAIAAGIVTGMLVERLFVSRLRARTTSSVSLLLLTLGVSQLLLALMFIPSLQPDTVKLASKGYPLPTHTHFSFGGVIFGGQYVMILVLTPLIVGALAAFLRYTVMGKMIRAAANNADAARLCGVSPRRVSLVAWGIAGGLSAISAVLTGPSQAVANIPALGSEQLFVALGAAAFGAFVSIPWALGGGLALGVVEHLTIGATSNVGTARLVMFIVVLAVIFIRGGDIARVFAAQGAAVQDRRPLSVPANIKDRLIVRWQNPLLRILGIGAALLLPVLPGLQTEGHRFELTLIVIFAIMAVSLTILIGWGGQLSLGHFAVMGMGAFVTARLAPHSWSLALMLLVSGLVGAGVLVIVGIPALRVRGLTLAVTTLGFALVADEFLFRAKWFTASDTTNIDVAPVKLLRGVGAVGYLRTIYYVSLAVLVAVVFAAQALRRSTPGRLMIAVRDDERATAAHGVSPATVKLTTLAVSGFFAAAAGALYAVAYRTVTPDQFAPELSLAILALPVIGGLGSVAGAVTASFGMYLSIFFISPHLAGIFGRFFAQIGFQLALSGLTMIGVLLTYPTGIAGAAQRAWEQLLARISDEVSRADATEPEVSSSALDVRAVSVRFGGIQALRDASIQVNKGEIVGLIGPNGAGKSTLLNVISGLQPATGGSVLVNGRDVNGLPPDLRAAHGLGRSFQAANLFPGLTVRETVQAMLGARARIGTLSSMVQAPWSQRAERRIRVEADALLARTGLTPWADALAAELSTGTRRICDLTLQLASRPEVLLLDEPTAGVAQRETEQFGPLLRRIRDELDCAIVIVEHDMPLLMGLCDRVYAMEQGHVIAEGTPTEIRNDPRVIASYLGTDEAAIERSGTRAKPNRVATAGRARAVKSAKREAGVAATPQ